MKQTSGKQWLLYDGRYRTDPDSAICFEVCDTLKEAIKNIIDYGRDTVIVEYETEGNQLLNPKILN